MHGRRWKTGRLSVRPGGALLDEHSDEVGILELGASPDFSVLLKGEFMGGLPVRTLAYPRARSRRADAVVLGFFPTAMERAQTRQTRGSEAVGGSPPFGR